MHDLVHLLRSLLSLVLFTCLFTSASGWAQAPADLPPMTFEELSQCELIVAGRYNDHTNKNLALEIVDVLRGNGVKRGDILRIAVGPRFSIKTSARPPWRGKTPPVIATVAYQFQANYPASARSVFSDATQTAVWFFPKAKAPALQRRGQFQPDYRAGWREVLAGKKPNLFFRLIQTIDHKKRDDAVLELFRGRDGDTIARLLDWLMVIDQPQLSYAENSPAFMERLLLSLGDRNGDVYGRTFKVLLGPARDKNGIDQAILCRILARADRKRASALFRKLLKTGSYPQQHAALWGSIDLENEDALNLQLDAFREAKLASVALQSLRGMLRAKPKDVQSAIALAHLRAKGYPRIQKIMKTGILPKDVQGLAEYSDYFGFLHGYWAKPKKGYFPANNFRFATERITLGRKRYSYSQFQKWQANADWKRLMRADLAWGKFHLEKVLAKQQGKWLDALAVSYGYDEFRPQLEAAQQAKAVNYADESQYIRPLLWNAAYRKRYLKWLDDPKRGPKGAGTTHGWLSIRPLYPEHPREYFQRGMEWAAVKAHSAGIHLFETKFFWNFDLNTIDFAPVHRKKADRARRMVKKILANDMLQMRGNLLREFGVKLNGKPSSRWLPQLREAATHPDSIIRKNALYALAMLVYDDGLYSHQVLRLPASATGKLLDEYFAERQKRLDRKLTDAQFKALWSDLATKDWIKARGAMRQMLDAPAATLHHLQTQLAPKKLADAAQCRKLIADLGSKTFRVRAKASRELKKMGRRAHPHLLRALNNPPSLEVKLRLRKLLQAPRWSPNHKQMVHAVDVLQNLEIHEGLIFLEQLAQDHESLPITAEARAAVQRLPLHRRW